MGGLRGTGTTDITVSASPALPPGVTPEEITLDIPKRFARSGPGLPSAYLPNPTFSLPRILEHGTLVAFTLCVNASSISAGSYVGQVIVGGPAGVQPATVAVSLNAKDEVEFLVGLFLAAVVALWLLLMRGLKVNYDKLGAEEDKARSDQQHALTKEQLARTSAAKAEQNNEHELAAAETAFADEEKAAAEVLQPLISAEQPCRPGVRGDAQRPARVLGADRDRDSGGGRGDAAAV